MNMMDVGVFLLIHAAMIALIYALKIADKREKKNVFLSCGAAAGSFVILTVTLAVLYFLWRPLGHMPLLFNLALIFRYLEFSLVPFLAAILIGRFGGCKSHPLLAALISLPFVIVGLLAQVLYVEMVSMGFFNLTHALSQVSFMSALTDPGYSRGLMTISRILVYVPTIIYLMFTIIGGLLVRRDNKE